MPRAGLRPRGMAPAWPAMRRDAASPAGPLPKQGLVLWVVSIRDSRYGAQVPHLRQARPCGGIRGRAGACEPEVATNSDRVLGRTTGGFRRGGGEGGPCRSPRGWSGEGPEAPRSSWPRSTGWWVCPTRRGPLHALFGGAMSCCASVALGRSTGRNPARPAPTTSNSSPGILRTWPAITRTHLGRLDLLAFSNPSSPAFQPSGLPSTPPSPASG